MRELRTTEEIIEEIKNIISRHNNNKKTFDVDITTLLGINQFNLTAMKRRNKVPFKEVLLFCDRCGIDPLGLIMKSC